MIEEDIDRLKAKAEAYQRRSEETLDIKELSTVLKCSKTKIYRLTSTGRIPCFKVGNELRFYWPDILDWMRAGGSSGRKNNAFGKHSCKVTPLRK